MTESTKFFGYQLLPCPFCGCNPEIVHQAHPSGLSGIKCNECRFIIKEDRHDKTAGTWNRRQQPKEDKQLTGVNRKAKIRFVDESKWDEPYMSITVPHYVGQNQFEVILYCLTVIEVQENIGKLEFKLLSVE